MSVNTKIYILLYKNKEFQNEIDIENFRFMRFDNGIYGQVWDGKNNRPEFKETFKKRYSLTDEEYELLQFYSYWSDDLLEVVDEVNGEFVNNFKKVPADKIVNPKRLNTILEKVYKHEKANINQYESGFLADTIHSEKNDIFKLKPTLKSILKINPSIESRFAEIEKRTNEFLLTRPVTDFLNLLAFVMGSLTVLEGKNDGTEVQIVFYEY